MIRKLKPEEIQGRQTEVNDSWSLKLGHESERANLVILAKAHRDAIKLLDAKIRDLTKEIISGEVEVSEQKEMPF